jgi:hypothetical protein
VIVISSVKVNTKNTKIINNNHPFAGPLERAQWGKFRKDGK